MACVERITSVGALFWMATFRHATYAKSPYTSHLRTLVPNTKPGIVFGTRVLKWAVCGPFWDLFSVATWVFLTSGHLLRTPEN